MAAGAAIRSASCVGALALLSCTGSGEGGVREGRAASESQPLQGNPSANDVGCAAG